MKTETMRGITHQLGVGGRNLVVTVCTRCDGQDPSFRVGWPGHDYHGVMHGLHRIGECHHPHHGRES